ncbi:MAG: bifunctional phosphoribosylaminoimidazolecarboxamide formyltransferase/IMP cyclohydrolase, partial [Verrucomicrobiota bacterium]|nr:bifunctional phosphoribosylaminoimidazolecarboxamide formyltransferase/IMP cyclohydrolase [Verrucomicrobiota bacterium]
PSYTPEGLEVLKGKSKTLRILETKPRTGATKSLRQVGGGWLEQATDSLVPEDITFESVSDVKPTPEQLEALKFAWRAVKHVKSNAIVYAAKDRTLGVGAGQMSRVDSSRIAVWKAGEAGLDLSGSAVCSDAFFPFADGLIAAAEAGATAAIQPGGSKRDNEVIAAANERGMAMAFTGGRHFKH